MPILAEERLKKVLLNLYLKQLVFLFYTPSLTPIIIHFRMSIQPGFSNSRSSPTVDADDSDDSNEFQKLQTTDLQAEQFSNSFSGISASSQKGYTVYKEHIQRADKTLGLETLGRRSSQLKPNPGSALVQQQPKIQDLYKNSLRQIAELKQKLHELRRQNLELKADKHQFTSIIQALEEEVRQKLDKITLLQQQCQLRKQNQFKQVNDIRQILEGITKTEYKNNDNGSVLQIFYSKMQSLQNILLKVDEISDMLIESKKDKNKQQNETVDVIEERYSKLERVQGVLVRQQNKINSLRDQNQKLEKELEEMRETAVSGGFGISKWFDPVMKFCKIEEGKPQEKGDKKMRKGNK